MRKAIFLLMFAAVLAVPVQAGTGDDATGEKAWQRGDYITPLREFLPLAKSGNPEAEFRVGFIYCQGNAPNFAEATRWFQLASQHGHANAAFNLGQMYAAGQGVPKSPVEAVKYYRMAANQGFADAQYKLGVAYEEGSGVAKD